MTGGYISIQAETAPADFRKIELLNLEGCMDPKASKATAVLREVESGDVQVDDGRGRGLAGDWGLGTGGGDLGTGDWGSGDWTVQGLEVQGSVRSRTLACQP